MSSDPVARQDSFSEARHDSPVPGKQSFAIARLWPGGLTMEVGFGATQTRRLLGGVEMNDRIGADRPTTEVRFRSLVAPKQTVIR